MHAVRDRLTRRLGRVPSWGEIGPLAFKAALAMGYRREQPVEPTLFTTDAAEDACVRLEKMGYTRVTKAGCDHLIHPVTGFWVPQAEWVAHLEKVEAKEEAK